MSLANLTLAELLILSAAGLAFITLLYLLDRTRRRRVVPTLRFWTAAGSAPAARRRRIREPFSLLLQAAAFLLLMLALAGARTGDPEAYAADHVLVLDASAWMAAEPGGTPLIEEVRRLGLEYVRALPPGDRVMVICADSLAAPLTGFEGDRREVEEAVRSCQVGSGAVDVEQLLEAAQRALALHARRPGEIVFVGSGRTAGMAGRGNLALSAPLRYIPIEPVPGLRNVGLRRAALRHSLTEGNVWEVFAVVANDGAAPEVVDLSAQFAGEPVAFRRLALDGGGRQSVTFPLRTTAGGDLDISLLGDDDFPADDSVVLRVPPRRPAKVVVYTRRPAVFQPLLSAGGVVAAEFRLPGSPAPGEDEADVVILDRCPRPDGWRGGTIAILPPRGDSEVRVVRQVARTKITGWNPAHPVSAGLRSRGLRLASALVLDVPGGWTAVAETPAGAVLAVDDHSRTAVLGFDPVSKPVRFDLAAPLLFGNLLRWVRPEVFRAWEMTSAGVGEVVLPLEDGVDPDEIEVVGGDGVPVPFRVEEGRLRFHAGRAGTVRVLAGGREIDYSFRVAAIPPGRWSPPEGAKRGLPAPSRRPAARVLWPWLALAAALLLAVEWAWFGRGRHLAAQPVPAGVEKKAA